MSGYSSLLIQNNNETGQPIVTDNHFTVIRFSVRAHTHTLLLLPASLNGHVN